MSTKTKDPFMQNSIFLWIVRTTAFMLLVPLVAMQFTSEMHWTLLDFIAMGAIVMSGGFAYVITARKFPDPAKRRILGVVFVLTILYVWTELAVGVLTNLGS